ncbi:class I SAM-dependent methyltransferase [Pigmentiphaga aceris]|uniref:Class I SAM-dependent methyltransferase n=1 Tax=Pigmentiphaga aceris TaxID=1940612 RepID=A0A5C0AZM8_9BURK|nr:class I SAM-dependent methyltransferase [Pigmentiphaga aceris]QEI07635.1 class I SAM-dependent methyltransferase [Pigmentiphaga aceris]
MHTPGTHSPSNYVPETSFGVWFLRTHVWQHHVLRVAIEDLDKLAMRLNDGPLRGGTLLDVGCGQGKSLGLLTRKFKPDTLIGLDSHGESLAEAQQEIDRQKLSARLIEGDCTQIALPDNSIDVLFCHQTFHHLVDQQTALNEFYRVLKPGGVLLFAESTKAYIDTWVIRLLFRHPMEVQKSAEEYLAMMRNMGFAFDAAHVSYPYLWWSRSSDFGLLERFGLRAPPPPGKREETLVNLAARKPY